MRTRVFAKHPDLLMQMLLLRMEGWSMYALARKYETDKTTIRHWCVRTFDVQPVMGEKTQERQITVINFTPATTGKVYKYQSSFDEEETYRPAKTYAQIRIAAYKRELVKLGVL